MNEQRVWIVFSSEYVAMSQHQPEAWKQSGCPGLQEFAFKTNEEMNAFLKGIDAAIGYLDSHQYDQDPRKQNDSNDD